MGIFQFTASDVNGKPVSGTVNAATWEEAQLRLKAKGMHIQRLQERVSSPVAAPASTMAATVAASPVPIQKTRTKRGSNKQRFFLFSKLATMARTGLTQKQAADHLLGQMPDQYRPSIQALAEAANTGEAASDVFERFPDLYPSSVVATVRAGEVGGFVPDAFQMVADQAEEAHKFMRWFWWAWLVLLNLVLVLPGIWYASQALLRMWDVADASGGQVDGFQMARDVFREKLIWPFGPIIIGIFVTLYIFHRIWMSRPNTANRHKLAAVWPLWGDRAKKEGIATFSRILSRLSASGIPPSRAYELAAETVPNIEVRKRMRTMAENVRENTKLSEIVASSNMFSYEYRDMISTADITGDLPGTLDKLAAMNESEQRSRTNLIKVMSGMSGLLWIAITALAAMAVFYHAWYVKLPSKVLEGMDP